MEPPFRFGHQLTTGSIDDLIAEAQAAEAAGFDIVTLPDHIGPTMNSPIPTLAAVAANTTSIRLGTFVLNNEMRNPVQLAWEVATLDRLSHGRFELGIGAGHTPQEFAATDIRLLPATQRKGRMCEAFDIIRRLLDGDTVTYPGMHYNVIGAEIEAPTQAHLPMMVAGNGTALLTYAGRHADIVGLNGLGRTLDDGHRHSVRFSLEHLSDQVDTVLSAATERDQPPELNALVQAIIITDDRERAVSEGFSDVQGLTLQDALATPYLAFGTHAEIAEQFRAARARWGLSYMVTRDIDAMAPIIDLLR